LLVRIFVSITFACVFSVSIAYAADETQKAGAQTRGVSQSGYDKLPQFGGPDGVSGELINNDTERESIYEWKAPQRWFRPWYNWKGNLKANHGVALGFSAHLLYQKASDSLTGQDDDAMGGIYRFQGSWTLLGRDGSNPGRIEWRVENRSEVGNFQSPSQLGGAVSPIRITSRPISRC